MEILRGRPLVGTVARLEPEGGWERKPEDKTPRYARVLCGKLDRNGAASCPGPLAWLVFQARPALLFEGMRLDGDVWRPTAEARRVYQRTGVVTEAKSEKRDEHLRRHRKERDQLRSRHVLLADITVSPVAVCVRCGEEQDLLDADDLALCANAML